MATTHPRDPLTDQQQQQQFAPQAATPYGHGHYGPEDGPSSPSSVSAAITAGGAEHSMVRHCLLRWFLRRQQSTARSFRCLVVFMVLVFVCALITSQSRKLLFFHETHPWSLVFTLGQMSASVLATKSVYVELFCAIISVSRYVLAGMAASRRTYNTRHSSN